MNVPLRSLDYYSRDYFTARECFIAVAKQRGAKLRSYALSARGPAAESLTIDTAYFGNSLPARLLLVSSGIHGVEGFAGSAIQQRFIDELPDATTLPAGCGVLLVHALNPYGFAWLRRVNENNVDLNRNGLARFPGPANEAYAGLAALLSPGARGLKAAFFPGQLLLHALRYGPHALLQAIAGGQYAFPAGLFYGGSEQQESLSVFAQILGTPAVTTTRHLLHIDLHTGLGRYGRYKLLPTQLSDPSVLLVELRTCFGDHLVTGNRTHGMGAYEVSGHISELTSHTLPGARVYGVTLEFGTYSLLRVLQCLRQENWQHHHGADASVTGRRFKTEIMECFCPRDPRWRYRVLEQGVSVLKQACQGFLNCGHA